MANSADQVFHTLELAQQIVYELELRDLFKALSITKSLWESKVPDSVCAEHLKRLGYPHHVIRKTSQSLWTSYHRITQAVDAISRGVSPISTINKIRTKRQKPFINASCEKDMVAPLVCQSSSPDFTTCDVYTLDCGELRLLHAGTSTSPKCLAFNGTSVMGWEDEHHIVIRKLKDWSLMARFESNTPSGTETGFRPEKEWDVYEDFIISHYSIRSEDLNQQQIMFEFWDRQGSKRGEVVFPTTGNINYYSYKDSHYIAVAGQWLIKSWNLESLELNYEYVIPDEDQDGGMYFFVKEGVVFHWNTSDPVSRKLRHWTVDGRHISKQVAMLILKFDPDWGRMFSDGTRVTWRSWLTLYDNEGEVVRRYDLKNNLRVGDSLRGGILFDRFFFSIFHFGDSSCASLVVYSKTGEELTSMLLGRQGRWFTWFVDILGRLVIVYEDADGGLDELEIIDFRGKLR
ncbi:hypothetical protein ACHAPU_001805 [Fusarium lateritium]